MQLPGFRQFFKEDNMEQVSGRIRSLIVKQMQGALSEQEAQELTALTKDAPALQELVRRFTEEESFNALFKGYAAQRQAVKAEMNNHYPAPSFRAPVRRKWAYMAVAASIVLLIGLAVYLTNYKYSSAAPGVTHPAVADIGPGFEKATLKLADNTTIDLTQAPGGEVATQGDIVIKKTGSGLLEYNKGRGHAAGINVLSTPRGGFFKVCLSDGSLVWLNAASSLTYPAVFTGNHREVQLSGEGYFEIAPDKAHPFWVKMGDGSMIEVVGTKFNCTAYEEDHHTTTTLLEGKVKLIATDPARVNERPLILQPGQQAEKAIGATGFQVKAVDASMAVSWVQGSFYFDRVPLSLVFKQLERWYDVQFEYDATVINSAGNFKGSFERNIPLSGVLNKLEFVSNIRFTLNGKKVKVLAP